MDKRDETMGEWDTIRDDGGASWQAAPDATFGDLPTLRDEGVVLAGRYKVVKRLGEGGMGSVWLAEDAKLDNRKVAVKMLPAILAGKKGAYKQVKAEAMVAMKLSHPNIATVRAFEEDEGGNPFLVMDCVEGEPLDDILAERGPLGEEETVKLLGPVAAALDYAHSQGVVHRDVKPGNVMVAKDGTPFVLDFGIAREVQETMTRVTGKLSSGTLLYMSPEQLRGKGPKAAQDVYSFAAMAYECLAGHPPFARGQIEWQIVNEAPEELPGCVGEGVRKGVMAGLAKSPEARPETCAGVLGQGTVKKGKSRFADHKTRKSDSGRRAGEKRKGGGWGWVLALLVVAGMAGWWWWQEDASRKRQEAEIRRVADEAARQAEQERVKAEEERLAAEKAEEERQRAEEEERERRERAAVEEAAYQLAATAKGKSAALSEVGYERGQGFGEKLDEMRQKIQQGEAALQGRNFEKAKAWFEESLAAAGWLETNAPLREAAKKAKEGAETAKERAERLDGAHWGERAWNEAEKQRNAAEKAFAGAEFRVAEGAWNEAGRGYAQAVKVALESKVAQGLEEARKAKGRGAWEECLRAALGVLALDGGNAVAKGLKKEAEGQLKPRILLKATVGGREVAATVTEGLAWSGMTTPVTVDLENGGNYSFALEYEEWGKKYAGQTTVMAKPQGTTMATAVLGEVKVAGMTKTIVLPGGAAMEMVWCPPGSFTMGSPENEEGRHDNETQHWVTLTKGFWMAKTEVTQKQWKSVMGYNPSHWTGDVLPVEKVNWNDAQTFCKKAGLSLPTEAEWEYACRAGSTGPYAGSGRPEEMGWYGENSGHQTHPVGQKKANAWGLYDMHGNVWEWCEDFFDAGYYAQSPRTDPKGPATGEHRFFPGFIRVIRGGDWNFSWREGRSASRGRGGQKHGFDEWGFRPVLRQD